MARGLAPSPPNVHVRAPCVGSDEGWPEVIQLIRVRVRVRLSVIGSSVAFCHV